MADITFDEVWEELKTENEESRELFQTAEDISKVINRLIEERVRQGVSQREMAKRCGLKQSAIARMESVKSIPRLDTVVKVADALGLVIQLEDKMRIKSVTLSLPDSISWLNPQECITEYRYSIPSTRVAQATA